MDDVRGGPRLAVAFDDGLWEREVGRLARGSRGRVAAEAARRVPGREGAERGRLAVCEAEAADGTRLGGLVKPGVPLGRPASEVPYGFVLEPALDEQGRLVLRVLAFGERHPDRPATRSVYERAHNRRRHGTWPSRQ